MEEAVKERATKKRPGETRTATEAAKRGRALTSPGVDYKTVRKEGVSEERAKGPQGKRGGHKPAKPAAAQTSGAPKKARRLRARKKVCGHVCCTYTRSTGSDFALEP